MTDDRHNMARWLARLTPEQVANLNLYPWQLAILRRSGKRVVLTQPRRPR